MNSVPLCAFHFQKQFRTGKTGFRFIQVKPTPHSSLCSAVSSPHSKGTAGPGLCKIILKAENTNKCPISQCHTFECVLRLGEWRPSLRFVSWARFLCLIVPIDSLGELPSSKTLAIMNARPAILSVDQM